MSRLVLIVGALMLAAGGYAMYAGSGDILSERGWSAFIAGSVLVAGGVATGAVGVAIRAVDRLRDAILLERPAMAVASDERFEPETIPTEPRPVAMPAPTDMLPEPPIFEPAPTAPLLAAASTEQVFAHTLHPISVEAPPPAHVEPEPHHGPTGNREPPHDDWLDHSFAELEREMSSRDEAAVAPAHPEPSAAMEPALATLPEPPPAPILEMHPEPVEHAPVAREPVSHEPVSHEPGAHEAPPTEPAAAPHEDPADHATVSAREEPVPAASPVIGRYESEGTSYVMYADGSIDAQSEAGIYRFASMSELKAFIES